MTSNRGTWHIQSSDPRNAKKETTTIAKTDHHTIFCRCTFRPSRRKKTRNDNLTHHNDRGKRKIAASCPRNNSSIMAIKRGGGFFWRLCTSTRRYNRVLICCQMMALARSIKHASKTKKSSQKSRRKVLMRT